MGKSKSVKQKNQSMAAHSSNATDSKANQKSPSEAGFHEPSRPSN
ncbi:hypothetical protein MJA45_03010 [Paenibacillus aurantius]|uniref:Uncharacterized protein n=1 Tax=Paenibacillus aurantius TaxID=2918900 RepID=A0AA96LID4_9BACL|nr:hypothetical protein [Paenibacillus aurantius]WJH36700.1 hypothetical protein N6H14_13775 [Paenibacillus sp. CC-CFT747]WNQ12047.1 hypothetical protein MJA45_03010 [Paenibacillus aurantius]